VCKYEDDAKETKEGDVKSRGLRCRKKWKINEEKIEK
jgi:hypothetical protein